jgi:hypothetical protein
MIQLLKRQVHTNTALNTDTDFAADGIEVKQAEVPSLTLSGPQMTPDAYGWENPDLEIDNGDGTTSVWPNPIYHTFIYGLSGSSDSSMEVHRMMGEARKFVRANPYVTLAADVPTGTSVRMPLVMTEEPTLGASVRNANYHSFDCSLELRRIPILYLSPYLQTKPVDVLELQAQYLTGTLVETKDLW